MYSTSCFFFSDPLPVFFIFRSDLVREYCLIHWVYLLECGTWLTFLMIPYPLSIFPSLPDRLGYGGLPKSVTKSITCGILSLSLSLFSENPRTRTTSEQLSYSTWCVCRGQSRSSFILNLSLSTTHFSETIFSCVPRFWLWIDGFFDIKYFNAKVIGWTWHELSPHDVLFSTIIDVHEEVRYDK